MSVRSPAFVVLASSRLGNLLQSQLAQGGRVRLTCREKILPWARVERVPEDDPFHAGAPISAGPRTKSRRHQMIGHRQGRSTGSGFNTLRDGPLPTTSYNSEVLDVECWA